MGLQTFIQTGTATAALPLGAGAWAGSVNSGLREIRAFELGPDEYGVDILRVQEIRRHEHGQPRDVHGG